MVDRLLLGSDALIHTVVEEFRNRSGTVRVVTDDDHLATALRDDGVAVTQWEAGDGDVLAELSADVVFVLEESYPDAVSSTRVVREAHPTAYVLAYTGREVVPADALTDHRASDTGLSETDGQLATLADRIVDPSREAAAYILDRIGDSGQQMQHLWRILRDIDRLAILTHDNPDPDAIASGVALARIASAAGCEPQVCYYGEITHQENRAFVNVLDLELYNLGPEEDVEEFDGLALVDHSRPGVNDQLPEDSAVDIVIDHHPPRTPVDARFVDLRSGVGATSTLLVAYLELFGIELDETVATALLFGIHVDTKAFTREVSQVDFEAAATLVSVANLGVLERIESPSVNASTVETLARAIQNRRIEGNVLLSFVGELPERDALAQAAERLLMLEDVHTTMVYGVANGTIFVSARSRGDHVDIGETLREAFDPIGSAGGHVDMAGAQITLGILEAVDEREESLREIVETVVADRFLEAVEASTPRQTTGLDGEFDTDQYLVREEVDVADLLELSDEDYEES